jgi:uncharacterized membrane-anchored protein YhcB (DUF1043 family)
MTERSSRMGHNARIDEYDRSLKAFFAIEAELDDVRERHKQERELYTEQQKDLREDLKEAGLSLKVFNELVTQEMAERRKRKRLDKLEDHVRAELGVLQEQLAGMRGTPLGDAAYEAGVTDIARKGGYSNGAELLNSLRPADDTQPAT